MMLASRGLMLAGVISFLGACASEEPKSPAPAARPAAAPAAPQAAQAPAPAPMPPAAAQPARDFIVYYDFNRPAIRPDAAAVLDQLIAAYRALGGQGRTVTVIGHADRAGNPRYNQRLSVRRADAVEAYLASKGNIAVTLVMTSGLGEIDPRVATPDGAREQQNRRAEIRIN